MLRACDVVSSLSKGPLKNQMWIEQVLASVHFGKADRNVGGSLHKEC
jgi:hypothetical protein